MIVLGFFANRAGALAAAGALRRRGFTRAGMVHKTRAGAIQVWDPFVARRLLRLTLTALLAAAAAGLAAAARGWPAPERPALLLGLLAGAALAGGLAAGAWFRRARHGVERRLLEDHARWLVSDETVLILQAPLERLADAANVLREGGEVPPVVFFLHPRREPPPAAGPPTGQALPLSQIEEHARRLAEEHAPDLRPRARPEFLRRLERARRWIHRVCADLNAASRIEHSAPPVAEWLLDNEYVVESNARDVQRNLPRRFHRLLPALLLEEGLEAPRVYALARELAGRCDLRLDRDNILAFAEAYQAVRPLTIGELWAYPQMLRIALIEGIQDLAARALAELRQREIAGFWANRLITISRREPQQLFAILAELAEAQPNPSPYFAAQLIDLLYDEQDALAPVQAWLERTLRRPPHELAQREQSRQTQDQLSISNAFTSLRQLALLDWRQLFEDLSHVERSLRADPAGVYAQMDFETRDRYRRAVEELARGSGLSEEVVARRAVARAAQTGREAPQDARAAHVGDVLVAEGRRAFARALRCREPLRRRVRASVYDHPAAVYAAVAGLLLAAALGLLAALGLPGLPPAAQALALLLAALPASQLALKLTDYLVTRVLPPRTLPKMDFERSGIPDAFRTLVVVPEMLIRPEQIRAEVEKLEIRFLANRESNLLFGLITDYTDTDTPQRAEDAALLATAVEAVQALNRRHPGERFFLFHRERRWSETEQKYIGWERKRGKLEELNRLIDGGRPESDGPLVRVGQAERLADVRFVITLDSDTQLPSGTARRLVETLAHPLNRPRFDPDGRVRKGTYTIIQPGVSPSLPSATATPFSRLFADAVGIDPYTRAVSDVYQDLIGEGSYHGKGIYDVRAFSRVLSGRFPEGLLLSHDLIEGAHVRVGLASDIQLQDEFPSDYMTYARREHRWTRGDWQIADWVTPRVPRPGGGRGPNPLRGFDRWKIFDNLRRSLVPPASLGLLLSAWLLNTPLAAAASALVAVLLLFQPLAQPLTRLTTRHGFKHLSLTGIGRDLLRALVEAALMPHQAGLTLDAILRVAYRRLISHRRLLEWTSPQAARWSAPRRLTGFVASMTLASAFSGLAAWAVLALRPAHLPLAAPWLALWFLSPALGWLLNLGPRPAHPPAVLPAAEQRYLRRVARRTWRFFTAFVNDRSAWLPPDNYQVSHREQVAMRTSPTNIGLWLLSALAAHDFGYQTLDQLVRTLSRSLETIGRLERHEGHLLNWYDLETLRPLEPRYVSAVDSGNLLAALWALQQGLHELLHAPLLGPQVFEGLRDTWEVYEQATRQDGGPPPDPAAQAAVRQALEAPPAEAAPALRRLRDLLPAVTALAADPGPSRHAARRAYWADQLEEHVGAWLDLANRYLTWIERLADSPELARLDEPTRAAIAGDLARAPSLRALATGELEGIASLRAADLSAADPALAAWRAGLIEDFDRAKWLAGEMLATAERLMQSAGALADALDLRFLYDPARRLLTIGYNATAARHDPAYYDLLASEARLGSLAAIAGGSLPYEHWFALGRPYNAIGSRRVLLSWSGTMFEYLMPLLLQRAHPHTLLDKAARDAVEVQIAYGRRRGVPWGISESAYGDLDSARTYQYRAFGVPALGLKRGLDQDLVVAPYATLLALGLAPRRAVQNLHRLADLGLLNDYGFFEAMDFTRRARRRGERGVIVRAYMAHHQGMGLLALANALLDNPFPRRFHADARVRAVESLLHERVPALPPLHHVSTRERPPSLASLGERAPSVSRFDTPHTGTPKTQLLSNGRYSLMVTNSGGGYSRWHGFDLTRWRADRTQDSWGSFCYLRDPESGWLGSAAFHPVGGPLDGYAAHFPLDRAVFRREQGGLHIETEIVVSPEDDVEIRRLTLINRGVRPRQLELTSCYELALAPHAADRQHPAFHKLFIQTEAVPAQQALLATRRPRHPDEPPIFVAHRLTAEPGPQPERLRFETDRRRFIGRGRSLARPLGLEHEPSGSQGYVLDPILSLRRTLTLPPGERVQVSLILAAADTRQQALRLMEKYADPPAVERAMDFAWASAQLELRLLRIQADDARRFQKLASHLLYPNPLLRLAADRSVERNRKGQAGLWAYGISGDLPIALISIAEARDLGLVRQMLQAHTYWRAHGLMADLVILNEEASGYESPLRERLEALIRAQGAAVGLDRPGGVFLRSADQIPEEDRTLLLAAASVVLVAARGTLPQQLGVPVEPPEAPRLLPRRRGPREPSAPLPFMELPYFNSLGGFTPDGREYAVYLGPGTHTPAPWVNVIANPSFGTLISESGAGFTWAGNSQRNRLTPWSNDPVLDPPGEALYLRDEETGEAWSPTAAPLRAATAYRARHGAGYTVFEHNGHGIEQELTVFVPVDDDGGQPLRLQRLRLKNDSGRRRRLSLTAYVEWTLGETREQSQMQVVTHWDDDLQTMLARNRYHPEYGERVAFLALDRAPDSYTGDRTSFLGRNRSPADPAALGHLDLSGATGAGLDPCGALRAAIELAPGETAEVLCLLGQGESLEQVQQLVLAARQPGAFQTWLDRTRGWWDALLGTVEVQTPELAVDFLVNRWLLYQAVSCRLWGRSAFYQSGGAYGFRDQLQDVLALLYARPELARQHLLLAASRQFREGDVQHWWHPPSGAGVRTRIADDLLWLPYAAARYVEATGDAEVLRMAVPFLDGPPLADDQHEQFFTPEVSFERATLYEHCRRALQRGLTEGPHGLPRIGTGDWNDGLDGVGAGGRGESVWLAWFLVEVLQGMAGLAEHMQDAEAAQAYRQRRQTLLERIEAEAWDGEWYLRATFDDGTPLGSAANSEARIDSLPQSWAWLAGPGDVERAGRALDAAWRHLVRPDDGLVLLFDPPFDRSEPWPGYIRGYPPGVRENGGQYTHGALWLAAALARRGDGTRAAQALRLLNPIERARDADSVWRFGLEPFVVPADVYRAPGRIGHGGWSWYTGSAAWMYRVWVEELLGLRLHGGSLRLDPVIPAAWEGFRLRLRHGEAVYEIEVENPEGWERGVAWIELDGRRLDRAEIPLERELVKHRVRVRLGPPGAGGS